MIVQEIQGDLVKTYSDKNMYVRGGEPEGLYAEAWDLVSSGRTYVETDIPIEEDEDTDQDKIEGYDILMGETE